MSMLLGGCGLLGGDMTYRYKMTVEVETPDGPRTGSSVIEVRTHESPAFPGPEAGGERSRVRGEAVAVDLPAGTLFALLQAENGRGAEIYAWALLPEPPTKGATPEDRRANLNALRSVAGRAELQRANYPMLVTFRDLSDPTTVETVNPADLNTSFGPGYVLHRITVQMTDEPVTTAIERWLPNRFWTLWAENRKRQISKGSAMTNPYFKSLVGKLNRNDFISER
ncbi:MAG: hypothetical protein QM676_03845 [Novosphingobium sp.]